jgi:uncharacterized protein YbjT (DUF2867 family)
MENTMQNVLVAGATGYLGRFVVEEFKKQGYQVRALARDAAKLEPVKDHIDETVVAEATDPATLPGITRNIEIVFSSLGITRQKDGLTFMDVDYHGNLNLLNEAKNSGVAKFIYVSVFRAHEMAQIKAMQAKLRFEAELRKSGLDFTIIYPNGFYSDMLEYLNMAKKGRGYVFGTGDQKINPIHGRDLAEVCVSAASSNVKEIYVGGPDILSQKEILSMAFDILGKKSNISRIPMWVRDFSLKLLRLTTPVKIHGPLEFFMTVLAQDMVAPVYGTFHLKDFFTKQINSILNE